MIHGVVIDDCNTLDRFGLCLLADVKIGMPSPRTAYVTIPEADGDMDLTGALTDGVVRYGMRKISFTLFPCRDVITGTRRPATEEHAAIVRESLAELIHGTKHKLWLPDDPNHYFIGRLELGDKTSYNNARIPVTMTAEPWRYRNTATKVTVTASGKVHLHNETRQTVPVFKATNTSASVTYNGHTHSLASGENVFSDIVLNAGGGVMTFSGVNNPVIITYQEAVL